MQEAALVPIPRCSVSIRQATMADYAFIDRLQDMHTKALGWMPKAQLESKIVAGHILIAESEAVSGEAVKREENDCVTASPLHCVTPVGYVMSQDRYFKRDDVGIVYQLNVSPGKQRSLVGAMLIRAVFDRAAYGCKLFCCWCAQDLAANYFWEALGFVPLAFRAGAKGRLARGQQPRAHIFWQKRIRAGDVSTPYWYPCKTDGGHMREDRIVLPIPPGTHWRDAMPMLLPEVACPSRACLSSKAKDMGETPMLRQPTTNRVRFGPPSAVAEPESVAGKKKPAKKVKVKCDPAHLAKARELRDRYLEHLNGEQFNAGHVLGAGKYEVTRGVEAGASALLIEQRAEAA